MKRDGAGWSCDAGARVEGVEWRRQATLDDGGCASRTLAAPG